MTTPKVNCDIKNNKYCDIGHYCKLTDKTAQTGTCEPCECDVPGYTANPCRQYYSGPNKLENYPLGCNLDAVVSSDRPDVNKVCDGRGTSNPFAGVECNENGLCPSGLHCHESEMCPSRLCVTECQDASQANKRDRDGRTAPDHGYWWDTSIKDTCLKNGWSPDGKNCDGTCSRCSCKLNWQKPDIGEYGDCKGDETSKPDCVNICNNGAFLNKEGYCNLCVPSAKILNNKNVQIGSQTMDLRTSAVEPGTSTVLNRDDILRRFCGGWGYNAPNWKEFTPESAYPIWAVTGCLDGYYLEKTHPNSKDNDYSCKECACSENAIPTKSYKGNCPMRDKVCVTKIDYPKYIACGKKTGENPDSVGDGCAHIGPGSNYNKINWDNGPSAVSCTFTLDDLRTPDTAWYAPYKCGTVGTVSCDDKGVCTGDSKCHGYSCCYNLCEKK